MYTVAAPLSREVFTFFKLALGVDLSEIYGMTEVSGAVVMQNNLDRDMEFRGGISPVTKCRLKDLPELGYYSTDKPFPRGEI
jgi:long-subunit acyl-CoA synthetase (AMP-forming)